MHVSINGELITLATDSISLLQFLLDRGHDPQRGGIAVAVNECVIPKKLWSQHILTHADQILLVQATQGG